MSSHLHDFAVVTGATLDPHASTGSPAMLPFIAATLSSPQAIASVLAILNALAPLPPSLLHLKRVHKAARPASERGADAAQPRVRVLVTDPASFAGLQQPEAGEKRSPGLLQQLHSWVTEFSTVRVPLTRPRSGCLSENEEADGWPLTPLSRLSPTVAAEAPTLSLSDREYFAAGLRFAQGAAAAGAAAGHPAVGCAILLSPQASVPFSDRPLAGAAYLVRAAEGDRSSRSAVVGSTISSSSSGYRGAAPVPLSLHPLHSAVMLAIERVAAVERNGALATFHSGDSLRGVSVVNGGGDRRGRHEEDAMTTSAVGDSADAGGGSYCDGLLAGKRKRESATSPSAPVRCEEESGVAAAASGTVSGNTQSSAGPPTSTCACASLPSGVGSYTRGSSLFTPSATTGTGPSLFDNSTVVAEPPSHALLRASAAFPTDEQSGAAAHAESACATSTVPTGLYLCTGHDAFLTHEPNVMDAMALLHARIARVIYAESDPIEGALGSTLCLHALPGINHRYVVYRRVPGFS